jgi:hypothetical protein
MPDRESLHVRTEKEYAWGNFTLWVFPEDELTRMADGRLRLTIESKDDVARAHGQRSRRELYWRLDFHVAIPDADLRQSRTDMKIYDKDIDGREIIAALKLIAGLFDVGCSIHVGDDSISIEGVDYPPGGLTADNASFTRSYEVTLELDDGGNYVDHLSPAVEKIKQDTTTIDEWYAEKYPQQ